MAWFKRETASPPASPGAPGPQPEKAPAEDLVLARVLDTLVALIREYGRSAFDLEKLGADALRGACEAWAQHLLIGAPRPGEPETREALPLERRDFPGVRRFFSERRREEGLTVVRALNALHQSLWASIQALDGVVAGGGDSDEGVRAELKRLQSVAQNGSPEAIRREVFAVVAEVGKLAQQRAVQQKAQLEGLRSQVKALGDELEVARQESALDPLTRLFNRRAFDERAAQAVAMRRLFGQPSTLLMLDLDRFKAINDRYGHVAGDSVLREVADCLARSFVARSDFVSRFGGEEFAVILWDVALPRARSAAERLLSAVRGLKVQCEGSPVAVTVSIGIAEVGAAESAQRWIERADRALYQAKHEGRDRLEVG
jgi:diguanylate cyclase (GGDEF)-like protein